MPLSESSFWKEAVNSEIDSILNNHTWELVDLPPDKYKAILVVKGFKQKEGLDYFDTYSPVTRLTSILILIALAGVYGLEIHQMDVKTAFLNGELEEEIYMEQPEGFVVPEKENKFKYMEFGIAKTPLDVSFALRKNEGKSESQLECNQSSLEDHILVRKVLQRIAIPHSCGGLLGLIGVNGKWRATTFEQKTYCFGKGTTSDAIGIRNTLIVASIIFLLGSVLMGYGPNYVTLLGGKCVAGVGVGFALMIAPVYSAEISSPKTRGFLTSLPEIGN
ncbi:putative polyol transporter 3 [Capsicum baccatum]|uniref:Polyol transporter 3 n=1 Tax=Capsicum baccatum TaxID=33114 RepID=A0A2G2V4V6_CAPBA|nr:putative polyol transporter 3 [Capsicum baccatum]